MQMRKRYLYGIILLMLSMAVIFSGCEEKEKKAEDYNKFEVNQMLTFESTYEIIGQSNEGIILNDYRIRGDIEDFECENSFWIYKEEKGTLQELSFAGLEEENTYFLYAASPRGEILIADEMNGVLSLFQGDGTQIFRKEMKEIGLTGLEENGIASIGCDEEYIYISTYNWETGNGDFVVLDYSTELIYQEVLPEEMAELIFLPNVAGPCMFTPDNGETIYAYEENALQKVKSKGLPKSEERMLSNGVFPGDDKHDFYYLKAIEEEVGVYHYLLMGAKDGTEESIFSFSDLGMEDDAICSVLPDGEDNFIVSALLSGTDIVVVYSVTAGDEMKPYTANEGKQKIVIGGLLGMDMIRGSVLSFNNTSENYYIEIKDYSTLYEELEDAENALILDITRGDNLDAVLLYGMDKEQLTKNGMLADLTPYLERGTGLTKDSIMPNVLEGMVSEDGKIYSVYPEYWLEGIVSNGQLDENWEESSDNITDQQTLFADGDAIGNLWSLLTYSEGRYIREEDDGVVVTEEFINLLASLKKNQEIASLHAAETSTASVLAENRAYASWEMIEFPYSYLFFDMILEEQFEYGAVAGDAPVLVPGFSEFGVLAGSNQQDGMYAFFDHIFSEDVYDTLYGNMYFPVLKTDWEEWRIRLTATEGYTDRYGENILVGDFYYGVGDMSVTIGSIGEEEAEAMMEKIESARYIPPMKEAYLTIIQEETERYFNGETTIESVKDNIENRLSYAMAEQG